MSGSYSPSDEAESVATLHHALDLVGVNFIDTADSCGEDGHNEALVGPDGMATEADMTKPIDFTKLKATIRQVANRRANRTSGDDVTYRGLGKSIPAIPQQDGHAGDAIEISVRLWVEEARVGMTVRGLRRGLFADILGQDAHRPRPDRRPGGVRAVWRLRRRVRSAEVVPLPPDAGDFAEPDGWTVGLHER